MKSVFVSRGTNGSMFLAAVLAAHAMPAAAAPLDVEDFDVSGSEGSRIEQLGPNWFRLTLSHAPGQKAWANWIRFTIRRNARGNAVRMDVAFDHPKPEYKFTSYPPCWSHDGEEWTYVPWEKDFVPGISGTLLFPAFEKDTVRVAAQLPMTLEDADLLLDAWRKHPHVTIHTLGKSLEGRNLYRVEITDPGDIPRARRWVHHVANQHPGEGIGQWVTAGMASWLLSDEAAEARKRTIGHFTLMMDPDGVAHGWCRVNKQGVDMNRSFRVEGADAERQPHEAFIHQRDFEALMRSEAPVTTSWSMHSDGRPKLWPVLVGVGPEIGSAVGPAERFRELIREHDTAGLVSPLHQSPQPTPQSYWDGGPHHKFGITTMLVEGGGRSFTKREALAAGAVLMKAAADYYRGTR